MPSAQWYTRGSYEVTSGGTSLTSSTIKALVVTNSYVFSSGHNVVADITNEVTGGGYARQTLASKTVTEDDGNLEAYFDCDTLTFSNLTASNMNAVIMFRDTGNDATAPLLCYCPLASEQTRAAQDLVVTVPANGWGAASVAIV